MGRKNSVWNLQRSFKIGSKIMLVHCVEIEELSLYKLQTEFYNGM